MFNDKAILTFNPGEIIIVIVFIYEVVIPRELGDLFFRYRDSRFLKKFPDSFFYHCVTMPVIVLYAI